MQIECLDGAIAVNFVGTCYCGTSLVHDVADGDLPLVNNIKVSHSIYVVRQENNETDAIYFLIKHLPINQHYPLQSSSLGKPHTAGDVAPTAGSSAGSLHVEVP